MFRFLALAATGVGLVVMQTAGAGRLNLLPERQFPVPFGGRVWGPLVAAVHLLLLLAMARQLVTLVRPWLEPRLPARLRRPSSPVLATDPAASTATGAPATPRPGSLEASRFDRWDLLLVGLLLLFHGAILLAYQREYNPEWRVIGNDHYSFLGVVVALGTGRWELYNGDKRPLYGLVSALVGRLLEGDFVLGAQIVAFASSLLIQIPTYLTGRLLGGRFIGFAAGLMLMAFPPLYPYATETGSYSFFSLVAGLMMFTTTWALVRGGRVRYLLAGIVGGLGFLTQIKGFTLVVPMMVLLLLALLLDGAGRRALRLAAITVPVALSFLALSLFPVQFTPLSVLIMHHREEVHVEVPFTWSSTQLPDPQSPSPISHLLPASLRGGEIEALAAVMMTRPDSDVFAAFPNGPNRRWVVAPGTSIPPLEHRIRNNLGLANAIAPGLAGIFLPLGAAGTLYLLGLQGLRTAGARGTSRERTEDGHEGARARHWPGRFRARARAWLRQGGWHPLVLLVPLASTLGSFSLKFHIRYLMHAAPAALILVSAGVVALGGLLLPSARSSWRVLRTAVLLGLVAALSVALFNRAPYLKGYLSRETLTRLFVDLPRDHRQLIGKGMALVADHVEAHVPANARILDCAHIALTLFLPEDPRLVFERSDSERDVQCREALRKPADGIPTWLFANNVPEFAGPNAVTADEVAMTPGWVLEYGYSEVGPRELTGEEGGLPGGGSVVLFRREGTTPALPVPHTHLEGAPAGIPGLDRALAPQPPP